MQYVLSDGSDLVRYCDGLPIMSLDLTEPPQTGNGVNGTFDPPTAKWLPLVNDGFSLFDTDLAPIIHLRGEPEFEHRGDRVLRRYPALNALRVGRA